MCLTGGKVTICGSDGDGSGTDGCGGYIIIHHVYGNGNGSGLAVIVCCCCFMVVMG